jgi:serine protease AprX
MLFSQNDDSHDHPHFQHRHAVIPTSEKLNADPTFTGRGVTIAFLDSGFYPHPDLAGRVTAFHDIHDEENSFTEIEEPLSHHWHGTQTVVSCAGDGRLSDRIYRGLAHEAHLVLVKASNRGKINDKSIEKGLSWVLENRERYSIRILNISLGGDLDAGIEESSVNQLVEEIIESGVVVTVAAGNSDSSSSIPPASSPSAITVGGYSDQNTFDRSEFGLYHSSFGATADGHVKPEIIAPAMYIAAPILPETDEYIFAETLSTLSTTPDYSFRESLEKSWMNAGLDPAVLGLSNADARRMVVAELMVRKVVATHYQHVDGTSFAAPITASVAALMLQANPGLTPVMVKDILIMSASRLGGHPTIRQGFGILNARLAVELALKEEHSFDSRNYFPPRIERDRILFCFHDDAAQKVALCGDFNGWDRDSIQFTRNGDGLWHTSIPCHPAGSYRYKLLIDGVRWTEDPSHGLKEDDGLGGLNSILSIT